ncbi:MAG: thrombospondin type 3 repeat-containing protein [Myxococcota bacterium]|nr:thrombospondin type 3 repeat-containing protein [Myxococcota bacterium]
MSLRDQKGHSPARQAWRSFFPIFLSLLCACAPEQGQGDPSSEDMDCEELGCLGGPADRQLQDQSSLDQQTDLEPMVDHATRVDIALMPEFGPPADQDGDGVPDQVDLCPLDPDPMQLDRDRDQIGDLCDADPDHPQFRLSATLSEGAQLSLQPDFILQGSLSPSAGHTAGGAMLLSGVLGL